MLAEGIICSLNEEEYIEECLQSLIDQSYTDVKLTLADSGSEDKTIEIAHRYNIDVLDVPKGKLNARDVAIRKSQAKIIIALDSDNVYPPTFFEKILMHFEDPTVVAVNFPVVAENFIFQVFQHLTNFFNTLNLSFRMTGGSSAFLRDAYFMVGGFDLTIDQMNIIWMVGEEEMNFGNRLAQIGKYVFDDSLQIKSSSRRANPIYSEKRRNEGTF